MARRQRDRGLARISKQGRKGKVRIIGGQWRGRKIEVPDSADLRPTPDRVRETLFNWLQGRIEGAHCLDLFAGSGALGFEALSRGAEAVTMVENDARVVDSLRQQAKLLQADGLSIARDDAMQFLAREPGKYDIVFADPPFSKNMLKEVAERLYNGGKLQERALVYMESGCNIPALANFEVFKQGRAGTINFVLLRACPGE